MRLTFAFSKILKAAKEGILEEVSSKTLRVDRLAMTPHQYWIAVGRGSERPYTGEYWFNNEVGHYHCAHCDNKLFSFENKFKSQNGYPQFWNHVKNSIHIADGESDDVKHAICKGCQSFVGKITFDGPPPTFIRYTINSASLKFKLKQWNEDPYKKAQEKPEVKKRQFV